ncbi:MAG: hypothetical protein JZU62_04600 [Sulfuricurvum sp.]|uniref:hypothetical protein n=1 Tax=Sulfuricurvum sp. TaxID=2025608 RepID=UPI0025FC0B47|nr:hypothetical protein [Sulfuricurvum sp.]MBV5320944.1 hypothetical protein [Sulfuricurvum sp.]
MNRIIRLFAFLSLLGMSLYGSCSNNSNTIFYCMTKKGKQIEVCDNKSTIEYSFGKPKTKPELVINVPRQQVTTTQWNGMGSFMSYSIDIPNANTVYNVFWGVDRMNESHAIEAGINVFINRKQVATVQCSDKIESNIEGIDLAPTPE